MGTSGSRAGSACIPGGEPMARSLQGSRPNYRGGVSMNVCPHGLTAISCLALLAACSSSNKTGADGPPPAGKDGPNVLADTADAVRPDSPPDMPVTPDRVDGPTGSVDA